MVGICVSEQVIGAAGEVTVSDDRQRLAWLESSGLHVYDRRAHAETINKDVPFATTRLTWSPDGSELALDRLVGDNSLHVQVLDVASRAQREVYVGAPQVHIEPLRFVSPHRLEFRVIPPELSRYDIPGPRYQINDDGTAGAYVDPAFPSWGMCGPSCGLPPDGYEASDGVARWCDPQPDTTCVIHVSYVDRALDKMTEITASSDYVQVAISPERARAAFLTLDDDRNQTLHLVQLDNLDKQQFQLGFTFANNLSWLDRGSLLLTTVGGN